VRTSLEKRFASLVRAHSVQSGQSSRPIGSQIWFDRNGSSLVARANSLARGQASPGHRQEVLVPRRVALGRRCNPSDPRPFTHFLPMARLIRTKATLADRFTELTRSQVRFVIEEPRFTGSEILFMDRWMNLNGTGGALMGRPTRPIRGTVSRINQRGSWIEQGGSFGPECRSWIDRRSSLGPKRRSWTDRRRSLGAMRRSWSKQRSPFRPKFRSPIDRRSSLGAKHRSCTDRRRSLGTKRRSCTDRRGSLGTKRRSCTDRRGSLDPKRHRWARQRSPFVPKFRSRSVHGGRSHAQGSRSYGEGGQRSKPAR